jgi:hypothetical protein
MMPLTRAQLESVLISRAGKQLALVGLDGTTIDGTNPALNDPIGEGLRSLSIHPADITAVSDGDLATVADMDIPQLLDVAELRCLESILNNLDSTDEKVMQGEQDWAKFAARLEGTIKRRRDMLTKRYGVDVGTVTVGMLNFDFQSRWDDCP